MNYNLKQFLYGIGFLASFWFVLNFPLGVGALGPYHVRPDGSDAACNGSANTSAASAPNCAFQTPGKAASVLQAGDTALIHAGTYSACPANSLGKTAIFSLVNRSGSAGAPITVKGAGDGPVVFQAVGGCGFGVYLYQSSYVTVGGVGSNEGFTFMDGFDFDNDNNNRHRGVFTNRIGTNVKSLGHTFLGNTAIPIQNDTSEIAFWEQTAPTNAEIAYNTIICKNAEQCISIGDNNGCLGNPKATGCPRADNAKIHHNAIIEGWTGSPIRHLGLRTRGCGGCEFYANYVNLGSPGKPTGTSGNPSDAVQIRDNSDWKVYNNYLYVYGPLARGVNIFESGVCPSGASGCSGTERHKLFHNTIYGRDNRGLKATNCDDCEVRNNLIVGYGPTSVNAVDDWDVGIECTNSPGGSWGYNLIANARNKWYGGGSQNAACATACSAAGTGCDADGTNVYDDPQLVDGASAIPLPYLRLSSVSRAVDGGASLGIASDYEGDSRGIPDIGADELGGSAALPPPPSTPPPPPPPNSAPTANAGADLSALVGQGVTLLAQATDDSGITSFALTFSSSNCSANQKTVSGIGGTSVTGTATIVCTASGTYTATVTAIDNGNPPLSGSDTLTLTITSAASAPPFVPSPTPAPTPIFSPTPIPIPSLPQFTPLPVFPSSPVAPSPISGVPSLPRTSISAPSPAAPRTFPSSRARNIPRPPSFPVLLKTALEDTSPSFHLGDFIQTFLRRLFCMFFCR